MADILILAAVGLVICLAAGYIRKEKKKGKSCIGCPYGGSCASKGNGGCGGAYRNMESEQ